MHLSKGYLGKKHCFVTIMKHSIVHLPINQISQNNLQIPQIKNLTQIKTKN